VASFFWSRSAAGRNNEERLIASLAYQLLTAIPQLRHLIEEAVATDPYIPICFLIASRPEKAIRDSFNDQSLLNHLPACLR